MTIGGLLSGGGAIVVALAILVVLVLVHEVGHFVAARRFNVRVREFGIGFPPRAAVLGHDHETVYTLNWLPLGGFVRLEGEDGGDRSDPRSFAAQSLGPRVLILASGVVMNFVLALVIFTGVAAWADPAAELRFDAIEPGSLGDGLGLSAGDRIEAIDGQRFLFFEQQDPGPALASRLGHSATLTIRHANGSVEERTFVLPTGGLRIGSVQPDSPAASAGLEAGDLIVAIDGQRFGYLDFAAAAQVLRSHAGESVTLQVRHLDGSETQVAVTLRPADQIGPQRGALGVVFSAGQISIAPGPSVPHDALTSLRKGTERTFQALGIFLGALGSLVTSVATNPTSAPPVAGPVGIVFAINDLLQSYPPVFLLWLAGILSANLAFFNVLPFPPLDGGRIAVGMLQAALGNRISVAAERLSYFVGFMLIIAFVLWVSYFDVLRGAGIVP